MSKIMKIEVTYICGQTGKKVVSSSGLPEGWVIPSMDLSSGSDEGAGKPLPHHTVVAFSSEEAYKQCMKDRLNRYK